LAFDEMRAFFDRLLEAHGIEVVYSPPSGPDILRLGLERSIDEVCFPLKMFFGHVAALADMGIDTVLVPRIISTAKNRNLCPKFHVLPDLIAHSFGGLNVLSPYLDLHNAETQSFQKHLFGASRTMLKDLGRWDRSSPLRLEDAWKAEIDSAVEEKKKTRGDVAVALLGHLYAERDSFLSLNTAKLLGQQGVAVVHSPKRTLGEPVPLEQGIYYEPSVRTARAIEHHLKAGVDGIVLLSFFACGPDSYAVDTFLYRLKSSRTEVPVMRLIFDEHTSLEGLMTRLSAFADVVREQKQRRARPQC
jgi:predicted nucleotide-binding protein (sugar kinase/HSP70/actin superfamily)